MLEGRLGSGQIDFADYLQSLRNTIEKDKKLFTFYTTKGATIYANFIKSKLEIYEKELVDMEAQMSQEQE